MDAVETFFTGRFYWLRQDISWGTAGHRWQLNTAAFCVVYQGLSIFFANFFQFAFIFTVTYGSGELW
jgi:hypothetical protein